MARSRNIKPGFFDNEILAECKFESRLLFSGLWTIADREGRLEDRPKKIKAEIFPYDNVNIEKLLNELANKKDINGQPAFIIRYTINGAGYIQIINFNKHQNPHKNEAKSTIPAPYNSGESTVQAPDNNSTTPADSLNLISDSLNPIKDSFKPASPKSTDSFQKDNEKTVPLPEVAYKEVVTKGGNTTIAAEWSHPIVGWAATKIGGAANIARAPEKDATYLRDSYIGEYNRLCEVMKLSYG